MRQHELRYLKFHILRFISKEVDKEMERPEKQIQEPNFVTLLAEMFIFPEEDVLNVIDDIFEELEDERNKLYLKEGGEELQKRNSIFTQYVTVLKSHYERNL